MARNYFLTTNALTALTDPDAVLATPLNLLSAAHRFDDSGNLTASVADIGLKNIHTILIPPGNSAPGGTDTLRGTSGSDVIFWDFQTLSGISISLSLLARVGLPSANDANVIERFDLGDGNDVINLTYNAGGVLFASPGAYTADATIFGGEGNDVVWSGAGDDTIFGGNGGDWLDGGAGNDTLFGGAGIDSLMGGSGDDILFGGDADVSLLDAGSGSDWVELKFNDDTFVANLTSGANTGSDGADTVFTNGVYGSLTALLGGGPDRFFGSTAPSGPDADLVFGEDGNDAISTASGNDTLFGGNETDVLWGGAGTDTIFGDAGNDFIYMGAGNGDVSYGGTGGDVWYMYRDGGTGNQIYDLFREGGAGDSAESMQSGLAVLGTPALDEDEGSDFLLNGSGVRETDHDIMDDPTLNDGDVDMVWVHQIDVNGNGHIDAGDGSIFQLDLMSATGILEMSVQFDARDMFNIVLWDNDAGPTGQVQDLYTWNGSNGYDHWVG